LPKLHTNQNGGPKKFYVVVFLVMLVSLRVSFFSIFGLDVSRRLSDEIGLFQMNMIVIDSDFASSLSDKYLFSSVSTFC
jgi:hypothetical protein